MYWHVADSSSFVLDVLYANNFFHHARICMYRYLHLRFASALHVLSVVCRLFRTRCSTALLRSMKDDKKFKCSFFAIRNVNLGSGPRFMDFTGCAFSSTCIHVRSHE